MPASTAFRADRAGIDGKRLGISTTGIVIGAVVLVAGVVAVTQLTCIGKDKDYCGSD